MKIQCEYCNKEEATIFCIADEAALCNVCDRNVHQANKFASRHKRYNLVQPNTPLCDMCHERRAILFCEQDRSIVCRDCDPLVHQTQKHNRFLLPGIQLSTDFSCRRNAASTISEYLTEILPGWKVEDILDSVASPPQLSYVGRHVTDEMRVPQEINSIGSGISSSMFQDSVQCAGLKREKPYL